MKFTEFILNENKNKESLDEVRIRIITDIADVLIGIKILYIKINIF